MNQMAQINECKIDLESKVEKKEINDILVAGRFD